MLSAFKNFIRASSSHLRFKFCHCGGILLTWQGLACKLSMKSKDLDAKFISVFSDVMPCLRIKFCVASDLKKLFRFV